MNFPRFAQRACALAALWVLFLCGTNSSALAQEYAIGADLSWLAYTEAEGTVFKDDGRAMPGLEIFQRHGYNWIRLRLFHTPPVLPNDLDYTIALAQEAKRLGFKFLLDFHYSDTWADPGHQDIPAAWEGLTHQQLVDVVFEYTRDTVIAFREAGVMPDMVQPGNEVNGGMMWPDGKISNSWDNFTDLLKAGIAGAKAGSGELPHPIIMVHIANGGNIGGTRWFFDNCLARGVEFDVIGQSYYPWWHGTFEELEANLAFMAETYDKDIYVVEAAYTQHPNRYLDEPGPFPETPEGQREFLKQLNCIVLNTPGGHGAGVFWWEPANHPTHASAARNMFDRTTGEALPVIDLFDNFPGEVTVVQSRSNLIITGDAADNVLHIQGTGPGMVEVSDLCGGSINGGDGGPLEFSGITNVIIRSRTGDDEISVLNLDIAGNLMIELTTGRYGQFASVQGSNIGGTLVVSSTGSTNTSVAVVDTEVGSVARIVLGNGDDSVKVEGSDFGSNLLVDANHGDNSVVIGGIVGGYEGLVSVAGNLVVADGAGDFYLEAYNAWVGGNFSVNAGARGDSEILIYDMSIDGQARVETGNGYDYVQFCGIEVGGGTVVALAGDDDMLAVGNSTFQGPVNFSGGGHSDGDTIVNQGANAFLHPTVNMVRFEFLEVGEGCDLCESEECPEEM